MPQYFEYDKIIYNLREYIKFLHAKQIQVYKLRIKLGYFKLINHITTINGLF
jgi:hypothetical protein